MIPSSTIEIPFSYSFGNGNEFSMMDPTSNSLRDRWPFQYQDIDSRMEEPMSTNGEVNTTIVNV
jgi:hypothetical protein